MSLDNSVVMNRNKNNNWWLVAVLGILSAIILVLVTVVITLNVKGDGECECDCDNGGSYIIETEDEESLEEDEMPVEEYIAEMNTSINQATTDDQKADAYLTGAIDLWYYDPTENNAHLGTIREYLQKTEELRPTMESAWWMYIIERQLGNEDAAAKYLEIAKDRGFDENGGAG